MNKRLFVVWGVLFLVSVISVDVAQAFTVSGTINNGTTNGTSNVYVVLLQQGTQRSAGYGTTLTSIPALGTVPFTIHGVSGAQGGYQLFAFMDVNGTGSLHTNDPFVIGPSFVVNGNDVTVAPVTLSNTPLVTPQPPVAPGGVKVFTTADAAMLVWQAPKYAYGGNGISAELADAYTVYWGKSPQPGDGTELGSRDVPASGGNYHLVITGLTPGDSLYFRVKAKVRSRSS